jgi:hypothetical protein
MVISTRIGTSMNNRSINVITPRNSRTHPRLGHNYNCSPAEKADCRTTHNRYKEGHNSGKIGFQASYKKSRTLADTAPFLPIRISEQHAKENAAVLTTPTFLEQGPRVLDLLATPNVVLPPPQ